MRLGSVWWCPMPGQGALDTKWSSGSFISSEYENMGKKCFLDLEADRALEQLPREVGESPPEILKPTWMLSFATCCRELL